MSKNIKNILLYSFFFVCLYTIAIVFVILPTLDSINDNKLAYAKKSDELNILQDEYEVMKKTQQNKEETDLIYEKVSNLWPKEKDISRFIVDLETMGQNNQLTLTNVTLTEPKTTKSKTKTNFSKVQFSFDTSTEYSQMISVIKNLESFVRYNTISSISINSKENNLLQTKITGQVYYGNK